MQEVAIREKDVVAVIFISPSTQLLQLQIHIQTGRQALTWRCQSRLFFFTSDKEAYLYIRIKMTVHKGERTSWVTMHALHVK